MTATRVSLAFTVRLGGNRRQKLALGVLLTIASLLALAGRAAGQAAENVATVDGEAISRQELSSATLAQMLPLHSQEYQIEARTLEKMIRQKLLESAAKKKGVSTAVLLEQEVDRGVAEPTEAEVLAYYLAQPERSRQPFPQVKEHLRQTLRNAQIEYAHEAYLDKLRSQAKVVVLLDPPRAKVTYDAARLKGSLNATVVIVEFADFQCPYCRQEDGVLTKMLAKYGSAVALAYRDFPVSELHPLAQQAAEASRCAAEQGSYWPMYELLMAGKLDSVSLGQDAHTLKLDEKRFGDCLALGRFRGAIERDRQDAERLGVTATPTFFINGIAAVGAETEESLSALIDQELARQAATQSGH